MIVPKRFGLKYSPKPALALEYQKPDSGGCGKGRDLCKRGRGKFVTKNTIQSQFSY